MNYKKYLPFLVAITLFAIITIIQFGPLFKGKVIRQQDIIQYKGMSKETIDFRQSEHREALWTNSMFGGMPAYQVSPYYSGNWMTHLDSLFHVFLPHPSGTIFMGFLGFFILLLCLEINPWLALVGSLAYGFSSYFFIILEVGHNSKANAMGYLAPILGGLILLMRGKYWLGFSVTLLFTALELNANHVQISYYGYLIIILVLAGYFIRDLKEKKFRPFFTGLSLFILASLISVLPNAGSLLATYEYGNYSTRGKTELTIDPNLKSNADNITSGLDKHYATQYSYGITEIFTFLIPDYKGGPSGMPINYTNKDALKNVDPELREQIGGSSSYFGVQDSTAGPVYLGAIVVLLAFLGMLLIQHPLKWPLFFATLLAVMLSWGKYFMGLSSLFMDYLPGYNKFRAVSMILVIAEITVPLLAVLALDAFMKLAKQNQPVKIPFLSQTYSLKKVLLISAAIVGGFCLLGMLLPDLVNSFSTTSEEAELSQAYKQNGATDEQIRNMMPQIMSNLIIARKAIFKEDAMRSFIFIALTTLALYLFLIKKLKPEILLVLLGIFIAADMWPVGARYLNKTNFVSKAQYDAPPQKTAADEKIVQDRSLDFRVLNLTVNPFQDATTSYYHKSIGGYHGAKLKKYDELISFHLFKEINSFYTGLQEGGNNDSLINALTERLTVLNMLNTRYLILSTRDEPTTLLNTHANGNAWFVNEIKIVNTADSEMTSLYRIQSKREAVLQQKNTLPGLSSSYTAEGNIDLTSYKPNDLIYRTETKSKGFAVFSEIYYPKGWNAYLDGVLHPYTCVDYLLRGMEVPAGKHTVEFKFEPKIYKTGNAISLLGSVLVLLCVAGGFYMSARRRIV